MEAAKRKRYLFASRLCAQYSTAVAVEGVKLDETTPPLKLTVHDSNRAFEQEKYLFYSKHSLSIVGMKVATNHCDVKIDLVTNPYRSVTLQQLQQLYLDGSMRTDFVL